MRALLSSAARLMCNKACLQAGHGCELWGACNDMEMGQAQLLQPTEVKQLHRHLPRSEEVSQGIRKACNRLLSPDHTFT